MGAAKQNPSNVPILNCVPSGTRAIFRVNGKSRRVMEGTEEKDTTVYKYA